MDERDENKVVIPKLSSWKPDIWGETTKALVEKCLVEFQATSKEWKRS